MATEASGGRTPDLGFFLEVLVYIRGFGVENKSGGLRAVHEVGRRAQGVGAPPLPRRNWTRGVICLQCIYNFFIVPCYYIINLGCFIYDFKQQYIIFLGTKLLT